MLQRLLSPIVEVRKEESLTAFMMFAYSFLAMTAYNAIKPLTRSKFIASLGADNLPYVLLAAGFIIGILMTGYAFMMSKLPRRWGLAIAQGGMAAVLLVFWFLFQTNQPWVPVAFYVLGLILGVLLISQFWTLANVVYDPRQAKRLFGFIGGGAPPRGIAGAAPAAYASPIWLGKLLIPPAVLMGICALLVDHHPQGERPDRSRRGGKERKRRESARSLRAAARVQTSSNHRPRHQLCGRGRRNHRTAVEHGRSGFQRGGSDRFDHRVPRTSRPVDIVHWLRYPGVAHEPDSPVPGYRVRADGPAVQPWIHGNRDASERRAVGAWGCARPRSVAALHR